MSFPLRTIRWVAVLALLGLPGVSPAAATPFTATWDVAPITPPNPPPLSPLYDCPTWDAGGLLCAWLWGQGNRLTFDATAVPEPASTWLVGTALLALLRRS